MGEICTPADCRYAPTAKFGIGHARSWYGSHGLVRRRLLACQISQAFRFSHSRQIQQPIEKER